MSSLDTLPVKDGFRLRGVDTTRTETFTDAAFAFALTLLVVSLDPPTSVAGLSTALQNVPSFLLSGIMLMMFWWGHHEWSRRFGLDDGPSVVLSCALVFTVLIYVYPLRFIFGLMMRWIGILTGLPLGHENLVLEDPREVNGVFVIYGFGFVAMCLALVLLNLHAWRKRGQLELNPVEEHITRSEMGAWLILAAVGTISIVLGLAVPPTFVGVPGWAYMLLPISMPIYGVAMGRRHRSLVAKYAAAPGAPPASTTESLSPTRAARSVSSE